MVSSFYKWLLFPALPLLFLQKDDLAVSGTRFSVPHPIHVSVVELSHNASNRTFEISCKIFTDDFEKVLKQNYKTKVDLINPPDKPAMDSLVKKYIFSHLSLNSDGKPVKLSYVGFEHENEAVYGYVQADNISAVKKVDITVKLMHDLFNDQLNIIHVIVAGERKSTKLDYPSTDASFSF